VLSEVVRAVAGRCEVYLDGGVRTGTDAFKALALGAKVVFVGRPVIYGLAYNVRLVYIAYCYALSKNTDIKYTDNVKVYCSAYLSVVTMETAAIQNW